ncbi:MAG TPA: anti-sigma factor [Bryobacteraceae bacterium]|nr:anti-sigma factor [Bryobacteraceae bacterium]
MTCDELRDQYELYALGVLDAAERAELDEHLHREGDPCIEGVRHARELVSSLASLAPQSPPPARLRNKVTGLVAEPKRTWNWTLVWIAATACLAVVAVWLNTSRRDEQRALARALFDVQSKNVELTRLNEAFALMNDPAAKQLVFGEGAPKPRGRVFVNPKQGVLLLASNLSPAPSGKIYEMWIIPKGGNPLPAGLFQSQPDGTAVYLREGAVDVATTGAIAVTLEPEAGSQAPTTTPLIVAAL